MKEKNLMTIFLFIGHAQWQYFWFDYHNFMLMTIYFFRWILLQNPTINIEDKVLIIFNHNSSLRLSKIMRIEFPFWTWALFTQEIIWVEQKKTDSSLTMNHHALARTKHKKSVVSGWVHRIFRACSSCQHFNKSLVKGKSMLVRNQYPKSFFEPIINKTICSIISKIRIKTKMEMIQKRRKKN